MKRFLDSSTSQPEVLTRLNDRPTSTQTETTSLDITADMGPLLSIGRAELAVTAVVCAGHRGRDAGGGDGGEAVVSTHGQADMRGLVTAGPGVRRERSASLGSSVTTLS